MYSLRVDCFRSVSDIQKSLEILWNDEEHSTISKDTLPNNSSLSVFSFYQVIYVAKTHLRFMLHRWWDTCKILTHITVKLR